jgi:Lipoprotein LpqB beta-propeller domain/Sporulation and spore germination
VSRGWVRMLLLVLLAAGLLAGCATVPNESPVQVLRKVTEGDGPALPPGPGDDANPLDLVRGFVNAAGSSENHHAAARRFLTAGAQSWDDAASLTVLADQFDTVYARPPGDGDRAVVRLRGSQIGRRSQDGSFMQAEAPVEVDIQVAKEGDQWRIDGPPSGTIVRLSDFQANFKAVRAYFMDPVQDSPVPDLRYLPANPARTMPSRMVDALLAGPSDALTGAATSAIPRTARLRSNVAETPDGAVIVDLTELGDLDDARRRLLAAQVALSLGEVNVTRVRLLDDGAPMLPDHPIVTRETFADLAGADDPRPDVAGLVVVGGKARTLAANGLGDPLAGPAGTGGYDLLSATLSADGQRLAAVNRQAGRQLLIGRVGGPLAPSGVQGSTLTRPTWTPPGNEVWTVRNGTAVVRVVLDQSGHPSVGAVDDSALTSLGQINDLRLSRDGMRVAAIISGMLVVGAVARSPAGAVSVRNVRMLLPNKLTSLVAVDWRAADQIAVAGRRPDTAVALVSVDGLDLHPLPTNNLTAPLTAIATGPGRPLLVTDQNGLWSFGADDLGSWRQLVGGASNSVAGFPG